MNHPPSLGLNDKKEVSHANTRTGNAPAMNS